jgi:hypothetical protein
MLRFIQCFSKYCNYHLQGEYGVIEHFGSLVYARQVGFDGTDWWSRRVGFCPKGV